VPRIAIVAALEREIRPLTRGWLAHDQTYDGRTFRFFENAHVVLVCAGIGPEAARRAAQAAIALHSPDIIYSAGFAGAATDALKIADILIPRRIINAGDGSSVNSRTGEGILVSFSSVANPEQKSKLAASFHADAVDMEASAVAQAAEARGVRFAAVKAISDARDFVFPPMENFIDPAGGFRTGNFALFLALRPWLWSPAIRLTRNSARASRALCGALEHIIESRNDHHPSPSNQNLLETSNRR
jgi:adenosylhomocysteine nucleosidase